MALKKRKKETEDLDTLNAEVSIPAPDESPYLNEEEKKVLAEQAQANEAKSNMISTKKMEAVVALVQNVFNLSEGGYVVNAFADKGSKSQISLSNEDFDLVVTIKDTEKFGIM